MRREFGLPEELRAEVLHALADLKQREQQAAGDKPAPSFHRPSDIPTAPARYVAHPYTLLQTAEVIGRGEELTLLMGHSKRTGAEKHLPFLCGGHWRHGQKRPDLEMV